MKRAWFASILLASLLSGARYAEVKASEPAAEPQQKNSTSQPIATVTNEKSAQPAAHNSEPQTYNYRGNFNYILPRATASPMPESVWQRDASGIQGITAILLALFNGGLLITSYLQWRAIGKQEEVADKTLLLQFRPEVIVRNFVLNTLDATLTGVTNKQLLQNWDISGQFYLANIGGSMAFIKEVFCMVHWQIPPLPMRRPYEGEDGIVLKQPLPLKPGQSHPWTFASAKALDIAADKIERFQDLIPGDPRRDLYVMGWVMYGDELGFERRTAFCRYFNPQTRRFQAIDDPDYEHEE